MVDQAEGECCAHMRVSYRTELVRYDGPDGEQSVLHPEQVPIRHGSMVTRGWWACDDCQHQFSPIPRAASRGSARPPATPSEGERWSFARRCLQEGARIGIAYQDQPLERESALLDANAAYQVKYYWPGDAEPGEGARTPTQENR